jgi:uncharacterized protein
MDYKISKYVHLFSTSEGKKIIYCSRSNSFLEAKENLFEYLKKSKNDNLLINKLDKDLMDLLKTHKIIVNNSEDEDFLLEHQFLTDQYTYSKSKLGLIIAPTIACNFECSYCFESGKKATSMDEETVNELISFIKLHKEAQDLDIVWYGGEPLLAFKTIQKILNKIRSEVEIPLKSHSIITNGYYFNSKVVDFFKEYPLNIIQITLDGSKDRHNSIRKQKKNGQGTYEKIIQNIDFIMGELPETQIHLRVNIDKNNIQDFFDAKTVLGYRWKEKNIIIYPGILRIDNETQTNLSCDALSRWDTAEFMFKLSKDRLLDFPIYPTLNYTKNCCATKASSYIIGPEGEIYKCWNDVSNKKKIIGYINQKNLTNSSLLYKYIVDSKWYYSNKCKKSFFLPICNGNCAWYWYRNKFENGKYNLCTCLQKAPKMLDKCLEYYYNDIAIEKIKTKL